MKMLSLAGAMSAILIAAASVPQATAQVSSTDPAAVKAGAYKVESYHTQVGFSISHFGFTDYYGLFSGATGTLQLDSANPGASKLAVTIPVQSILTTVPQLTDILKGDQWFDAAKYPTATFTSTQVVRTSADTATIVGDLMLHGVTKPVTLKVHLVGSGVNPLDKAFTAGFSATGTIKRSDFGISQFLPLLGDDVQLTIAGAFELQP